MQYRKKALVLGAGGFIGSHMVKRLKSEGYWVRGVDLKRPEFSDTQADEFILGDLREPEFVRRCLEYKGDRGNFYHSVPYRYIQCFDEIYQFAADMGGAGFVFTGENDAEIMQNSVTINLNVLEKQRLMNELVQDEAKYVIQSSLIMKTGTKQVYSLALNEIRKILEMLEREIED